VPAPVRPQILELQKDSEKNGVELAEKIHELQQKRAERDEAGQARRNHLKSASDAAEAYQSIAAELPHLRRRAAQAGCAGAGFLRAVDWVAGKARALPAET
jgi:hypothetical protein